MNVRPALILALCVLGCSGPVTLEESVAEKTLALNACEETILAEHSVDGFPAYAQCESVSSESIWSNNGIDTSTTSLGDDWVRTQWGGGYQCTEWAYRYMYFRFGVDYRHGDAREWCDGDLPSTLVKALTPMHGDLIVFDAGACGADGTTGHIAVIDTVDMAEGTVTVVEQNRVGRRPADQTCGSCFLHAVANDGGNAGAGGMAGNGGAETAGAEMGNAAGGSMAALGGAAPEGGRSSTAGDAGSAAGGVGGEVGAHAGASGEVSQGALLGPGGMPPVAPLSGGSAAVGGAPEPVPTHNAGMPTFAAGSSGAGTSAAGQGQVALPAVGGAELPVGTGCGVATHAGRDRTSSALWLLVLFAAAPSARRRRPSKYSPFTPWSSSR